MFFLKWKQAVIITLLFFGVFFLSGCGDSKSIDDYLQDAQVNIANNENNEAIIALKNAIRLEPTNAMTRLELGKLYLKLGDAKNAEKEVRKAEELAIDINKIAPLLVEISLIQTNFNEVIVYSEKIKSILKEPAIDLVQFYYLTALSYEGSLSEHLFEIERLQQSQNPTFASLGVLFKFLQEENYRNALDIFEGLQNNVNMPLETFIIAGRLYTFEGAHDKASITYQRYLATRVKDHKAKVLIAESLIEEARFEDAEVYIDQVLSLSKNHAFALQLKAVIFFNKKEFEKAKAFAGDSVNNGLASNTNKFILAISHFQLGNYEQSISYFSGIIDFVPLDHPLRRLYLMLQLKLGFVEEVSDIIINDENIDEWDANLLVAASYELIKSSKLSNAKTLLSKLEGTEFDPASSGKLGFMKLAAGDATAEDDLLAASLSQPSNEQLKIALAMSYFKNKKTTEAINLALDWVKTDPILPSGYNLAGYFYMQTGQVSKAKDIYQQALIFIPANKPSLLFESYEREKTADILGAEKIVLKLIDAHPDYIVAYSRLYQLYKLQGKGGDFIEFVKAAYKKSPNPELILLMANTYLELDQFEEVILLLSNKTMLADKKVTQIKMLAQAYEGLSNHEKALSTYEELLELNSNNRVSLKLLALYEKNGLYHKALLLINKSLSEFPSDSTLLYLKSLFEALKGNIDTAQRTLDTLRTQESDNIYFKNIQGLIYLKSGRYEKAQDSLLSFYEEKPSNKTAINIYIAKEKLDEKESNIIFLRNHLSKFPDSQPIRLLLAQLQADTTPANSIKHYNYILNIQPDNWPVLNNLAWSYARIGEFSLAEKYIRSAIALNKNSLNLVDTLTYVLQKQNRPEALLIELDAIDINNISSIDITLRYAWALIKTGNIGKAKNIIGRLPSLSQEQKKIKDELLIETQL